MNSGPLLPAMVSQGSGDTAVFLLHGVGGGKEVWRHNMPALAQAGYRIIAWDMPGLANIERPALFNAAVLQFLQTQCPV